MDCKKCKKKMKLVSSWIEKGVSLSEYKCECGHVETVEAKRVEEKKETKVMIRQVPEWAHVHLTRLLQQLKEKLPENYEQGKYTITLTIWTDNTFQVNINSTVVTDDGNVQHTFTWNKYLDYIHWKKKEGEDLLNE